MAAYLGNLIESLGGQTMFTIGQAIENWKHDLRQKQTLTESDIEELESHLQEEIERLTPLGLSEEEAFIIATRRIGDTSQMAAEFAKVNTAAIWKVRFFWMLAGIFVLRILTGLSTFVSELFLPIESYFHWFGWFGAGIFHSVLYGIFLIISLLVFYFSVTKIPFGRRILKLSPIAAILIIWLILEAGGLLRIFSMMFIAKICSAEQIGQLSLGRQYSGLVVSLVQTLILVSLFVMLRPRKAQTA